MNPIKYFTISWAYWEIGLFVIWFPTASVAALVPLFTSQLSPIQYGDVLQSESHDPPHAA